MPTSEVIDVIIPPEPSELSCNTETDQMSVHLNENESFNYILITSIGTNMSPLLMQIPPEIRDVLGKVL